jgi:hypothetical protein
MTMSAENQRGRTKMQKRPPLHNLLWSGHLVPSCAHGDFRQSDDGLQMICEKCGSPAVPRGTVVKP